MDENTIHTRVWLGEKPKISLRRLFADEETSYILFKDIGLSISGPSCLIEQIAAVLNGGEKLYYYESPFQTEEKK